MAGLIESGVSTLAWSVLWSLVFVGVGIAFAIEWRAAVRQRRAASRRTSTFVNLNRSLGSDDRAR